MPPAQLTRDVARAWVAASLYFAAAAATIHLTSNGRDIAALWPANAILVAMLLAERTPRWLPVLSAGFLANIAANALTRGAVVGPMAYGIANIAEVAIAVVLLRPAVLNDSLLASSGSVFRFILVCGLVAPTCSALLGGATAHLFFGEPLVKSATI